MNESNTYQHVELQKRCELITQRQRQYQVKLQLLLTEYLGLLSWHGTWYIHGMVVLVVVGGLCKRERHCLCKVVFGRGEAGRENEGTDCS